MTDTDIIVDPDVLLSDATKHWAAGGDTLSTAATAANIALDSSAFSIIGNSPDVQEAYGAIQQSMVSYLQQGAEVSDDVARVMLDSALSYVERDASSATLADKIRSEMDKL